VVAVAATSWSLLTCPAVSGKVQDPVSSVMAPPRNVVD
jgi:hypothetical protein